MKIKTENYVENQRFCEKIYKVRLYEMDFIQCVGWKMPFPIEKQKRNGKEQVKFLRKVRKIAEKQKKASSWKEYQYSTKCMIADFEREHYNRTHSR